MKAFRVRTLAWIAAGTVLGACEHPTDHAAAASNSNRPLPAVQPAPPTASIPAADSREPKANAHHFPHEFQVTSMRGTSHAPYLEGNTLDAIEAAQREGIQYIEVDLVATRDGTLVTAHQSYVKDCGTLSKMTLNQSLGCRIHGGLKLATLDAVLALPFKGLFLDLKDTREPDQRRAQMAVESAARAVVASRRSGDTVLMVYDTPEEVVKPIVEHGLRGGIKGYPKNVTDTEAMVTRAAELGFEMICVNTDFVTPDLLAASAKRGIWHLPWSTDPSNAGHWRALAEAGAGGLIVLHYELAKEQVAPYWVDARSVGL